MNPSGSTAAALADLHWLRGFAAVLAADVDEADDLAQETLVAAWAKPPDRAEASVRPWLAAVLRNRWRMLRRGDARRDAREDAGESASTSAAEPERELERLEVLRILLAELEELPEEDRSIIVRRFFDGESAADIGRALDQPAATVRSRLHRALKRLRTELDRRYGDRRTWCAALGLTPMVGGESIANSTRGGQMSITIKAIIVAGTVTGAGAASWYATRGPESAPPSDDAPPVAPQTQQSAQRLWEVRRRDIRAALDAPDGQGKPAPTPPSPKATQRHRTGFREFVNDCLDDLESKATGALTIDVVEIGAPDVGVIYESVDVVGETVRDEEVMTCIIESMYAFVGNAPQESYEHASRTTLHVGRATDPDAKAQQAFDYVVGAHLNEVRFCQTKSATPVEGPLTFELSIAADGTVAASSAADSELPRAVVDCTVEATKRWQFPPSVGGRTLEYTVPLPVRAPPIGK
jgi:RNA polymerase sigma-70 factor (ECF subfamily)